MLGALHLVIPLYLTLFVAEGIWCLKNNRKDIYSLRQTIANFSCTFLQVIPIFLLTPSLLIIYEKSLGKVALFSWPTGWLGWVLTILLMDSIYYWNHRLHHKIPLLWAFHVVHHQSSEMNFSVGMRTAVLSFFSSLPFFFLAALLGVPPLMMFITQTWLTTLMVISHTQMPLSYGVLRHLLVSPTDHRVHHGIQPKYADKNFSSLLIIWDKIFGTYQREEEAPLYGIPEGHPGYSVYSIVFVPWRNLFREMGRKKGIGAKLRCLFSWKSNAGAAHSVPYPSRPIAAGQWMGIGLLTALSVIVIAYGVYDKSISAEARFLTFAFGALLLFLLGYILDKPESINRSLENREDSSPAL